MTILFSKLKIVVRAIFIFLTLTTVFLERKFDLALYIMCRRTVIEKQRIQDILSLIFLYPSFQTEILSE